MTSPPAPPVVETLKAMPSHVVRLVPAEHAKLGRHLTLVECINLTLATAEAKGAYVRIEYRDKPPKRRVKKV
jgi:hypothetical protein